MKNPVILYETDFFNFIHGYTFDLVITSPSISVLDTRMDAIFEKLCPCMSPDGYILFDMPAGYSERLIKLYDAVSAFDWSITSGYIIENMYPNSKQYLYILRHRKNIQMLPKVEQQNYNILCCSDDDRSHRAEFNADLIRRLIEVYTQPKDVVFDPFMGTATVPIVANQLGRIGIGTDVRSSK